MWVVKLGGSLHDAPVLRHWLERLATMPGPARVIVPGGGPFADAVRALQPALGVGELAAHRMAILAMQQFGLALQALEPRLGLAETDRELRSAMAVVWLPWRLAGRSTDLEASWDVTSDSIACWLATRLGAGELVLVKSAEIARDHDTDRLLSVPGLVDPAFAHYRQRFAGRVRILHREAWASFTGDSP